MSKSSKSHHPVRHFDRPNEGIGINVIRNVVPQANGTTVTIVGFDLSNAPVPDRRYVADTATVILSKGTVKLVFAQETITSKLRSMLIIHMTINGIRHLLSSIKHLKNTDFDTLVNSLNLEHEDLLTLEEDEPEQTIALSANMVAAAFSGNETCLDFYSASAFVMANIANSKTVPIDPVVRVDLRTSLFVSLRDKLQELESSFPPELNSASVGQ